MKVNWEWIFAKAERPLILLLLLTLAVPPLIYVVVAPSFSGRLLAVAFLALMALRIEFRNARRRGRYELLAITFAIFVGSTSWLLIRTPSGVALPGSRLGSYFPGPTRFSRWSPLNILPEIDQMYLGSLAITFVDPILDWRGAQKVRALMMPGYQETERDPEYKALGSVSNTVLAELTGQAFDTGHAFEYVPEHQPGEKLPAVLFLHGSLGNFKVYLWEWRQFADKYHFIVVLPSFGAGNWWKPGGVAAVERAREHLLRDLPVDPSRLFLIGLSNGGTGVSRAGQLFPNHYAGLGFISGVIEDHVIASSAFQRGWQGRPVLILHGEQDDRIDTEEASHAAKLLAGEGVRVTTRIYPHEDHFLILSQRESVLAEVAAWTRTPSSK